MQRKGNELRIPLLLNHIRFRKKQSLLIFISCRTRGMEHFLIETLHTGLKDELPVKMVSFADNQVALLQYIVFQEDYSPDNLYVIAGFPFDKYYKAPGNMETTIDRLAVALNLKRDFFPSRGLKCVIICPPEVENRLALKAPDFYQFVNHSVLFADET